MSPLLFNFKKALSVFGYSSEAADNIALSIDTLPAFARSQSDNRLLKSWSLNELPAVGKQIGFMKKPDRTVVAAVFVTKGGVLKSSLSLNLARMAALMAGFLWLERLSSTTMSLGLSVGQSCCSTQAVKLAALIGWSKTNGASIRSHRSAAMKVIVFQ